MSNPSDKLIFSCGPSASDSFRVAALLLVLLELAFCGDWAFLALAVVPALAVWDGAGRCDDLPVAVGRGGAVCRLAAPVNAPPPGAGTDGLPAVATAALLPVAAPDLLLLTLALVLPALSWAGCCGFVVAVVVDAYPGGGAYP